MKLAHNGFPCRMTTVLGALLLTAALAVGCQNNSTPTPDPEKPTATTEGPGDKTAQDSKTPPQDPAPGQDTAKPTDTAETQDGPCQQYAATICKEAGDKSETCGVFKTATSLMPPQACKAGIDNMAFTTAKLKDMGKACDALIAKLCKDIGEGTQSCEMVRSVTKTFPPDRCQTMMASYPEVLAELKKMEERNKPLDATKQAAIAAADAPGFGPKTAKVTIVEFSDFQCPYCSKAAEVTTQLKEKYKDKVRVVFRQFPLSFHKDAHLASQAALAAHKQGKFWEYHDLLFKNQKALGRPALEGYAKTLGLDLKKFNADLDAKTFAKTVDSDLELGKTVGVEGTPSMFLNGARVTNPNDLASLSAMIDTELAK